MPLIQKYEQNAPNKDFSGHKILQSEQFILVFHFIHVLLKALLYSCSKNTYFGKTMSVWGTRVTWEIYFFLPWKVVTIGLQYTWHTVIRGDHSHWRTNRWRRITQAFNLSVFQECLILKSIVCLYIFFTPQTHTYMSFYTSDDPDCHNAFPNP